MGMITDEGYVKLRRSTFSYVYRAGEQAWVDPYLLAVQEQLKERGGTFAGHAPRR